MKIRAMGEDLIVRFEKYAGNGRLAVVLVSEDGSPFATLSCNIPEVNLKEDEFVVKNWSENEQLARSCRDLFEDTGKSIMVGHAGYAPIWRIKGSHKFVVTRILKSSMHFSTKLMVVQDTREDAERWISQQDEQRYTNYTITEVPYNR